MATPYEYCGEQPRDYPTLGLSVQPGDIAYFNGRPPGDGRWRDPVVSPDEETTPPEEPVEPPSVPPAPDSPPPGADTPPEEPKRPNKAASADDWRAYALAMGIPTEIVEAATRQALIDHFTGDKPLEGVEPVESKED